MSDGERVVLYLLAQCLSLPSGITFIIDEPETHLHRSIMNVLWSEVEKIRDDCFFIYLTHDTQFAAQHANADIIWLQNYDGVNWKYQEITDCNMPKQLLLDILGNRRNVLFVEGTSGSYDFKLYNELYSDYYVIPCGSCREVIERTKSFKKLDFLHDFEIYGLIDRDYRTEDEINKLKENGINVVDVAEVENLFIVEEVLELVNELTLNTDLACVENVKDFVVDTKFTKGINKQIMNAIIAEIKHRLETITISTIDSSEKLIEEIRSNIDFEEIKRTKTEEYNKCLEDKKYSEILKKMNQKGIINEIGKFWGIANQEYCNYIFKMLNNDNYRDRLKNAFFKYLPQEF